MLMVLSKGGDHGLTKKTTRTRMTPDEVRKAREELGVLVDGEPASQQRFAELLGVGHMTVSRWECGKYSPNPLSSAAIQTALTNARKSFNRHINRLPVRETEADPAVEPVGAV